MAGEGSSFQDLRPEKVQQFEEQFVMTKDFIDIIQLLDVCNHASRLRGMMERNSYILDKIVAFIQKEEVQLRRTEIEMIKHATEALEGTDSNNATSFRLLLQSKARLLQQIQIALQYGSLMKLLNEKHSASNDEFLLRKQDTLQQMVRRYQERYKCTEPSVSVQLITNTKTGELEVNIIRKQLHTTERMVLNRERDRLASLRYKSIFNDEGNKPYLEEGPNQASFGHFVLDPLKDCGRAKLRKEGHLARLEARERIRDTHRQGLKQIDQDFMARMQRIAKEESVDQLELLLSALDLDDCENDEIDITH
ncbi:hypothetical protein C0J52_27730 [Blattella germanica]|nr:hypothetical protein C0J52_27730 [Blattella germanica]